MPSTSNIHQSHMQIQEPRTSSSLTAFKEQEARRTRITQPTVAGGFSKKLFRGVFFTQLTLVSILVIVLTIRGLITAGSNHFQPKKWYPPLLASVAASGIVSLAWQCIILCNLSAALKAAFWLGPLLTCSVGTLLVLIGPTVCAAIGAVLVFFAITQSMYACWVNPRFEYASKILSVSTAFPPAKTKTIISLSVIASVFYSGFMVTGIGGATSTGTSLDILFISVILISLAWTMQVFKNTQEVAISRARYVNFACGEDMDACNAFHVTRRHLLGSVCIGSTLVPVIALIRGSARGIILLLGGSDEVMFSFANCYSNIANTLITYGNRWGFVHVGAYDKGFVEASVDTWEMFRRVAGFEQLIDSDITSSFCFVSGIAVGAVSALAGGTWALLIHKDYALEVSLYAFIIGYFMCRVALAWLQACVLAYYVAYAEDPQSARFDSTIPRRIEQLQRYNAHQSDREMPDLSDL